MTVRTLAVDYSAARNRKLSHYLAEFFRFVGKETK